MNKQNDQLDELVSAHRSEVHEAPAHLKQQWHDAIDQAATLDRGHAPIPRERWHPGSFFWGMAVSAVNVMLTKLAKESSDETHST